VATFQHENPRILIATGQARQFDPDVPDEAPGPAEGPLLWASSLNPVGRALRLAEAHTARLAPTIDWDRRAAVAQEQAADRQWGADTAQSVLGPLTPPVLDRLLTGGSDE
jgi:hypothetical protein